MSHSTANIEPAAEVPDEAAARAGAATAPPAATSAAVNRTAAANGSSAASTPGADSGTASRAATRTGRAGAAGRWAVVVRRSALWVLRWLHDYFAVARLLALAKSLLWVGPLTILIWVYAERQQLYTQTGVALPVEVVSGDPSKFALLQRPIDGNVVVSLKGPKANIDRLREQLRTQPGGGGAIQIQADRTGREGEQTLTIPTARIGQDKRFLDAGITIENPQPESLIVRIEPMVSFDVPIQVRPDQREQFQNVVFTPAKVSIRGPASVVGDANDPRNPDGRVMVYAVLANRPELQGDPDDPHFLRDVKLELSVANPNVTMMVPVPGGTVTANVSPSGLDTFELPSLPVKLYIPAIVAAKYEWDELPPLYNVQVSGPKLKIDKLRNGGVPIPFPYVDLTLGVDAKEGDNEGEVHYQFEPGVTVTKGDRKVTIRLRRRTQ